MKEHGAGQHDLVRLLLEFLARPGVSLLHNTHHFGLHIRWISTTSCFNQKLPKLVFMYAWDAFVAVFAIPLLSILDGDPVARQAVFDRGRRLS